MKTDTIKKYAKTAWSIEDIVDQYDVTDDEAHEFLQNNETRLRDLMIERGWNVIETYAEMGGLKKLED